MILVMWYRHNGLLLRTTILFQTMFILEQLITSNDFLLHTKKWSKMFVIISAAKSLARPGTSAPGRGKRGRPSRYPPHKNNGRM